MEIGHLPEEQRRVVAEAQTDQKGLRRRSYGRKPKRLLSSLAYKEALARPLRTPEGIA